MAPLDKQFWGNQEQFINGQKKPLEPTSYETFGGMNEPWARLLRRYMLRKKRTRKVQLFWVPLQCSNRTKTNKYHTKDIHERSIIHLFCLPRSCIFFNKFEAKVPGYVRSLLVPVHKFGLQFFCCQFCTALLYYIYSMCVLFYIVIWTPENRNVRKVS